MWTELGEDTDDISLENLVTFLNGVMGFPNSHNVITDQVYEQKY